MKRILLSFALILASSSVLAVGSTGAFFADTQTSAGNTFTAGAIELKIDNHSFYNANECKEVTPGVFQWVGNAPFPVPGSVCTTTWGLDSLQNNGITIHKFFDFQDIKPGDTEEDTISLHVNNNDAFVCGNIKLTSNDENTCTEPETLSPSDPLCFGKTPGFVPPNGAGNGQLAQNVNFIMWADDGDNVLENNEHVIFSGPISKFGPVGATTTFTFADSSTNVWTGSPGPVTGGKTYHIGKAWCFGNLTAAPLVQDGLGTSSPRTPGNSTGGITCDGTLVDNSTQDDSLTADVTFSAVQARHNDGFMCVHQTQLTLIKNVDNTGGGTAVATAWTLSAAGPTPISGTTGSGSVTNATVTPGIYNLSESGGPSGYTAAANWSCVVNGAAPVAENSVTLANGDSVTCTITNSFQTAKLTVKKVVVNNNGGTKKVSDFQLFVDDGAITTGVTSGVQTTLPPGSYSVSEVGVSGYQASFNGDCDASGQLTLTANAVKACTITNTELPAHITLIKNVTGPGLLASNTLFGLSIDGVTTPTGASVAVTSNAAHVLNEAGRTGYSYVNITGSPKCPAVLGGTATLSEGEAITCTITNNKN